MSLPFQGVHRHIQRFDRPMQTEAVTFIAVPYSSQCVCCYHLLCVTYCYSQKLESTALELTQWPSYMKPIQAEESFPLRGCLLQIMTQIDKTTSLLNICKVPDLETSVQFCMLIVHIRQGKFFSSAMQRKQLMYSTAVAS